MAAARVWCRSQSGPYTRRMAVVCTSCGSEIPTPQFCSECAAPIALRSRGSRRTVTILFADVSGSTSLGEQLDAESMRA